MLELGDQIAAYRRSVTKYIAEHPATAVGAAFGAGILLGAVARNGVLRVATVWGAERVRQGFVAAHDDAGSN
ncbi:MAG: hypothetical protein R3A78_12080 [Polyangiales bacterium]